MRPTIKYLSDAEVIRVHEKALEMLENLGMKFEGAEAENILQKPEQKYPDRSLRYPAASLRKD